MCVATCWNYMCVKIQGAMTTTCHVCHIVIFDSLGSSSFFYRPEGHGCLPRVYLSYVNTEKWCTQEDEVRLLAEILLHQWELIYELRRWFEVINYLKHYTVSLLRRRCILLNVCWLALSEFQLWWSSNSWIFCHTQIIWTFINGMRCYVDLGYLYKLHLDLDLCKSLVQDWSYRAKTKASSKCFVTNGVPWCLFHIASSFVLFVRTMIKCTGHFIIFTPPLNRTRSWGNHP